MSSKPVSVAILTQYFYPEVPGAAQIATDLALGLNEQGFEVSVYTGQPAYWDNKRLPSREVFRGIHVRRVYSRRLSRSRLSRKGTNSRLLGGLTVATITLFHMMFRRKPDVVLVDSVSPFLLVVGWLLRRLRGVPYVFLVHDVYPEIAIRLNIIGARSRAARLWRLVYKRVYRAAARIIVLGPRMNKIVQKDLAASARNKCVEIPNWADGDFIVPLAKDENPLRKELGLDDKLVILYSGNMGPAHDMETVVLAAERLLDLPEIQFLFIGDGGMRDWVESTVRDRNLTNVELLPYQPQDMLPFSLNCGDISVVTLKRGMEGLMVPSKIYSSLAAGLAIMAVMGPGSEIGDIVEEYSCGYRIAQGDVDGLVDAVRRLHQNPAVLCGMRIRARACFEERYTRSMSIERYASLFRGVASAV